MNSGLFGFWLRFGSVIPPCRDSFAQASPTPQKFSLHTATSFLSMLKKRIETQILTEGISLVHQMINRPSYSTRSLRGIAKGLSKIRKCVNSHLRLLSDDWKRNGREIHNATRNQSCCRWISGQLADIAQRIETEN
jgi:hypothetical protein